MLTLSRHATAGVLAAAALVTSGSRVAAQTTPPAADTARTPARVDVKILPTDEPPKGYDAVYLVPYRAGSHIGYVSNYLRHPYTVRLRNVADEQACRARVVEFTAPQGAITSAALTAPSAKVTPDWVRIHRDSQPVCQAGVRWRLGDVPGSQTLNARLQRDAKRAVPDTALQAQLAVGLVEWRASAHPLPNLAAGFSYTLGPNPQPRVAADSLLGRRGQPFFGIEVSPLAFSGYRIMGRLSEHVRATLGTSYRAPGRDFYIGLNPIVLLDGLRTTVFPIQSSVGYRRLDRRGALVVAGTANASALFGTFLGAVLPPSR